MGSFTPGSTLETTMPPAPAVPLRQPRDAGDGPVHSGAQLVPFPGHLVPFPGHEAAAR
ncbi:hypothetical protein ABZ912_00840 [Nonomuraea angiospora]|uniref:hypothetical protein n=1 Tax=Nonomuraea angiospora TaxID=46172 RepID=UPI0033ED73E0